MSHTALDTQVFATGDIQAVRDSTRAIQEAVEREDVAVLRGLISPEVARSGLARVQATFDAKRDTTVDHKSHVDLPSEVPNYQRLMLGEWGANETEHAMYMRCFYNPLHAQDVYGLHDSFRTLTRVRNLLQGVDEEFCLSGPERGVYTLSRLHQYPAGGGFLKSHIDSTAAAVPGVAGLEGFIQVLMVMSEKGSDFHAGGGYFVRDGERIYYEDNCSPGDVLIYNGRTLHGVESVDPQTPPSLESAAGRYSALVTLYRIRRGPMSMG